MCSAQAQQRLSTSSRLSRRSASVRHALSRVCAFFHKRNDDDVSHPPSSGTGVYYACIKSNEQRVQTRTSWCEQSGSLDHEDERSVQCAYAAMA